MQRGKAFVEAIMTCLLAVIFFTLWVEFNHGIVNAKNVVYLVLLVAPLLVHSGLSFYAAHDPAWLANTKMSRIVIVVALATAAVLQRIW